MTFEEYVRQYGPYSSWGDFSTWAVDDPVHMPGQHVIEAGMLQFTEDTADRWAGPFPGGFALFVLSDHTNSPRLVSMAALHADEEARARKAAYYKREYHRNPVEHPTDEKPVRLWLLGNDDTSYSKFYATAEEGRAELALLLACQPLKFNEMTSLDGMVFTN